MMHPLEIQWETNNYQLAVPCILDRYQFPIFVLGVQKKLAKREGIHPQQHLFQELTMERHILGFDTLKNTWHKYQNSETLIHR